MRNVLLYRSCVDHSCLCLVYLSIGKNHLPVYVQMISKLQGFQRCDAVLFFFCRLQIMVNGELLQCFFITQLHDGKPSDQIQIRAKSNTPKVNLHWKANWQFSWSPT